ncbi:DUF1120 domain-containing protein [Herbaspirillum sp. RV1423]|uniref:DUF1120 domain-containing protein n=1 Tax=Herbaspirillum sp. RV1423 TaxID=1443993 RepID=UPI0004BCB6A5|nr:DUF1120 domain-containing protein [Herbaspirillum sp. RV1423]
MNKHITLLSALAASLLLSAAAQAADTAELKVKGVIKPSACTPTLTASGVVDYGTMTASTLKPGIYTTLPEKQVSMTVTCDAHTKVALLFTDNRAATRVTGIVGSTERFNFGLGSVAGKNIGGYTIKFDSSTTIDGVTVANLHSTDAGATWSTNTAYADTTGTYMSFATSGTTPSAGKVFTVALNVQAVINKPENLPTTQDIPLDGSTTIEVKYL